MITIPIINTMNLLFNHLGLAPIARKSRVLFNTRNGVSTKIKMIIIFLLGFTGQASAAQYKKAQDGSEINAQISAKEISRVKVVGDRIKSVKKNDGEFNISADEQLGDIYIRPNNNAKKPINLFVNTEQGNTYKLLLTVADIPAEQIFIENNHEDILSINDSENYKQKIIKLYMAMQAREKYPDFKIKQRSKYLKLNDKINGNSQIIYEGKNINGEIYKIKNNSKEIYYLQERDFYQKNVIAVKLDNSHLAPNESGNLFIISRRGK